MKFLSDNPNLNHLRQQAKDLLAGLRDENPATPLAEAQAVLAQQYGFHSWPSLKSEVDRRQSNAAIAAPSLAAAVAERYGLGKVTAPMKSMAQADYMGRAWSLETDRGRWVAQTVEGWMPFVDVEAEVALQEAAAAAGVQIPAPVRSASGAIVDEIDGHQWRVNVWRHSGPPLSAPVSATVTRKIGEILATIHSLKMAVDRISPWHAKRLSDVTWSELLGKAQAQDASWAGALEAAVPTLIERDAIGEGAPTNEPVLCHNVLGPNMVRKGRDDQVVVFGWEHAGGQPPDWELADALMFWTDSGANRVGAQALTEGYRSVAGELPLLGSASFRGVAISAAYYTLGQVEEALARPNDKDAQRSVRHLLSSHLWTQQSTIEILDLVGLASP